MEDIVVVSVDDNSVNLLLIEALVKDLKLQVKSFTSAKEAIAYIAYRQVDVIITDYMMPEMHGIDFIKDIRRRYSDLPVVMLTAVNDDDALRLEAFNAGVTEFLNKPFNQTEFKARLLNLVKLRKAQLLLKDKAALLEDEVRKSVRVIEEREHEALYVLGRAAEYKDLDTASHINRVSRYSIIIMRETGATLADLQDLFYAAPLHDIGKIGVPDSILLKPGIYTSEEFDIMKKHPHIGYDMLKDAKSPYLQLGAEISISHHEKFDGTGYPHKLKGREIPLCGRIVAIADVFDALTTERPYKGAWTFDKAMDFVCSESGKHFDPEIVGIFINKKQKIKEIFENKSSELASLDELTDY